MIWGILILYIKNLARYKLHILPKRACIPSCTSFGFLLLEKAAKALKISGAPLPMARNVTPLGLHLSKGNLIPWYGVEYQYH